MAIRCPNKSCNTKISVIDRILYNPKANIICPSCKQQFKPFETLPKLVQEEFLSKGQKESFEPDAPSYFKSNTVGDDIVVGWIVVHDENTKVQTYDLKLGRHLVGRKSTSLPCEIMIDTTDRYMHRNHFYITVEKRQGKYVYLIESHEMSAKGNGTYIDTQKRSNNNEHVMKRLNLGEQFFLEDGALIQAGRTKIVLKTCATASTKEEATSIVSMGSITKTVIV